MSRYHLIATSAFGLESVVASELEALGYGDLKVENGRVDFAGDERDIARCNLWLRCADRLLLRMAEFRAVDFEELYQGVLAVPWENFVPENGIMHMTGKSIKSTLFSVPDCQSIAKRAVIDAMKRRYRRDRFTEDGPLYRLEVALLKDIATITMDTSGPGLHKRGYRQGRGDAPLRETLAAAMVLLSKWDPSRVFADPLCGSGTIPIEAALAGRNMAPGLNRSFAAEDWSWIPKKTWGSARDEARDMVRNEPFMVFASDHDYHVFSRARENAEAAGVTENITFQKKPVEEFSSARKYGCIVCNPPYGERMGERRDAEKLYRAMGKVFGKLDAWSIFILSSHPEFERHFGRKATRNRKLYNGKILCHLYQYRGPLPPRRKREGAEAAGKPEKTESET